MTFRSHKGVIRRVTWATVLLGTAAAEGTIGPPVRIKMAPDTKAAVSGQPYEGIIEIQLFKPGELADFVLAGEGWTQVELQPQAERFAGEPGVKLIPFTAVPADADKALRLTLTFDGRLVSRTIEVGPAHFAEKGKPKLLQQIENTSGLRPGRPQNGGVPGEEPSDRGTRGGTVRVVGRVVYMRTDGKVTGADRIDVRVIDVDPILDEEMWSGLTDENGFFDSGDLDADVDGDGSGPDLRVQVDTSTGGWVDVTDTDDDTYVFVTPEFEDYEGSVLDLGLVSPLDLGLHPALHIFNVVTRTRRFALENPGYGPSEVQVIWPSDGTYYQEGPEDIHIEDVEEWNEDVPVHEYGHHFMHNFYDLPDPEYCLDSSCDTNPPADCGHCIWCQETDHDALNEGWPDWLADVVTRAFPDRYQFDDGTDYEPILSFRVPVESLMQCGDSGMFENPVMTEGFVAALLRDIEDPEQDDHDADGIFDLLCLGPNHNFDVINNHHPITVLDFINGFRADYPQHIPQLWPTAFNVGGAAYVAGFPTDTQPPGVVPAMNSTTHPLGVGGSLPCITIEFDPAPDDASGACQYSTEATRNPAGVDPIDHGGPVRGVDGCKLTAIVPAGGLGEWYISIKAQDHAGNWSDQWSTFGPFEVLDCNNTGQLDGCDISCGFSGIPGVCDFGISPCFAIEECAESSADCNGNFTPDECDLDNGVSEDCNRDGTPDECQTAIIKHFTGAAGLGSEDQWELAGNWLEGAPPVDGDHVCIPLGTPSAEVKFSEDIRQVTTLNCDTDFRIQGSSPELRIDQPSYVSGDLTLAVTSTLRPMTSLDVGGELTWQGLEILGPGTVNVFGGFDLTSPVAVPKLRNSAHLSILDGAVNVHGNEFLELNDTSTFSIGLPVTYTYDGSSTIFAGAPTTIVNVNGSLIRNSGTLTATIGSFVLNSGLIHNRTGNLTLSYGGTHSGFLLGDPGTLLRLNGSHDFLAGSSLVGDDITFGVVGVGGTCFVRGGVGIADALLISGTTCTFTSEADVASYGQHLIVLAGSARLEAPSTDPLVTVNAVTIGDLTTEGSKDARFNTGQPVSINTLSLVEGDIHGADPITINNSFVWGTGGGQIASGGAITCNGPATIQGNASSRSLNRAFNNAAYATFLGAFTGSGPFNNLATGTVELRGDSTGLAAGSSTNAGLIVKTQGTGSASSLNGLNNSGQVRAEVGEIRFNGGGTNSGGILGLPGTLLRFAGAHEMLVGSSLEGDDLTLDAGTTNIRGAVDIGDTLTINAATCTFTNQATVTSYGRHLDVVAGSAEFQAPASAPAPLFESVAIGQQQAEGSKVVRFNTGQPVSIDTLSLIKGDIHGADLISINNSFVWGTGGGQIAAGGAITCNGPVTIQGATSARSLSRVFNNADYATFFGGFTASGAGSFNNLETGTIDLRNTGTAFGLSTTPTLSNHGLLVKSAGSGVSSIANHFRNTGTVEVQIGTLELYGGHGLTHIQTAGETALNGGSLSVTLGAPYQIQGGDLTGAGAISGVVQNSGGTVRPGLSAGQINITGTYSQSAAGALEIEVGGPVPGVSYDRLAVSGTASLAGTLRVELIGGYIPAIGEQYVILTAGSRTGTFGAVESLTPGLEVDMIYSPTTVTVEVISFSSAGDCDFDGDADLDDYGLFPGCLSGPEMPHAGSQCDCIDANADGAIDLGDFAEFQADFTG